MAIEFEFTPDQEAFRSAARSFLAKEVTPIVAEMDEKEEYPRASVRRMQEEGYFGVPIPEEYGGLGLGKVGYCILLEELGTVDASHGAIVGAHTSLGTTPLLYYGTEEQKKRWLVPAAQGRSSSRSASPNPGRAATRVPSSLRRSERRRVGPQRHQALRHQREGSGHDSRHGRQRREEGPPRRHHRLSGRQGHRDSGSADARRRWVSTARSTAELILENVEVGSESVLGGVGMGFRVAMTALFALQQGGRIGGPHRRRPGRSLPARPASPPSPRQASAAGMSPSVWWASAAGPGSR